MKYQYWPMEQTFTKCMRLFILQLVTSAASIQVQSSWDPKLPKELQLKYIISNVMRIVLKQSNQVKKGLITNVCIMFAIQIFHCAFLLVRSNKQNSQINVLFQSDITVLLHASIYSSLLGK